MRPPDVHFDPRVWFIWWIAASLPALTGRNPVVLVLTLLIILLVRTTVPATSAIVSRGVLRLFVIFALIGVLFNVLTVHAGDIVLWTIPDGLPIIGGDFTLNAVLYGLLGAIAILTLVLSGITVAEQIDWPSVMRLLPESLLGIGVAGSIAFTFFPQMIGAFRDIREARIMRGAPLRTPADYASVVSPMLASGLDRAVTLSELLEVRAFGGHAEAAPSSWRNVALAGMVALMTVAAYSVTTGSTVRAVVLAVVAALIAALVWVTGRGKGISRTRYRTLDWTSTDTIASAGALLAIAGIIWSLTAAPAALRYEPYPSITWPAVSVPLLMSLCGVAAPAFVVLFRGDGHD